MTPLTLITIGTVCLALAGLGASAPWNGTPPEPATCQHPPVGSWKFIHRDTGRCGMVYPPGYRATCEAEAKYGAYQGTCVQVGAPEKPR